MEVQSINQVAAFKQIPRSPQPSHQRISVVGTIGSGKTTFARKTSQRLDAPHIELDALHWEPNWIEAPTTFSENASSNHCKATPRSLMETIIR